MMKFKRGDKVMIDNQYEGVVLSEYDKDYYEVRIFSGLRHVGDRMEEGKYLKLRESK